MILADQTKIFMNIIFSNNLCLCSLWCQYYIYSGIRHRGTFFSYIVRRTPKWTPIFKKKVTSWRRKNPSLKNSTIWTLIPCFAKIICRPNLFGWSIIVFIYGSLHTFAKGRKKMEIRREILRFLLRVHLATAINAPMFHNYHFDVFQDYELFYKSRNKVTCASWAVWQILLMLLFCKNSPTQFS